MKTDLEGDRKEIITRSNEVRKEIIEAAAIIDESYQTLAQLLYEAYDNGYYLRWGFGSFKDYCEDELGVQYRKARYLVSIAQTVKELGVEWGEVEGIGWTKMRVLIPLIKEEGVGDWFELAKQYSVKDLERLVKDAKEGFDIKSGSGENIVTLTFRMTPESSEIITDALDTAKRIIESTDNVMALEQMAYEYIMQQGEVPERSSLESLIKFAEQHYGVTLVVEGREEMDELIESTKQELRAGE